MLDVVFDLGAFKYVRFPLLSMLHRPWFVGLATKFSGTSGFAKWNTLLPGLGLGVAGARDDVGVCGGVQMVARWRCGDGIDSNVLI